jgi:hypothetical protein
MIDVMLEKLASGLGFVFDIWEKNKVIIICLIVLGMGYLIFKK